MSELWIVLSTELSRKLRSRIFWLATLGGTLVIALLVEAPVIFASLLHTSSSDIVLAGPRTLCDSAATALQARKEFHIVARLDALPAPVTAKFLEAHGRAGAAFALSVRGGRLRIDVYPRDLAAYDDVQFRDLAPLAVSLATGLPLERVTRAASVTRAIHPVDAKFADARVASVAHGVAFGLILMLYLAIILGSQSVMAAVAEEKTSRIAEILVATISPATLLYGKTIAAALVAFAQVALWIITAALLVPHALGLYFDTPAASNAGAHASLGSLDPFLLIFFLAFFVCGYLQFAAVYAAAASLVSRTEELGMVTTPVIMPVVGAFFVAQYALLEPGAPIVVACSFVPFVSPFVAFARIAVTSVPAWQIALALGVNLATVGAAFYAAGKIYRVGMLLYGKAPSLRQIGAALRA